MANVSISMDDNLKKQAEDLFNDLGMNLTTAFTIVVKQAIREQGIPVSYTHLGTGFCIYVSLSGASAF